MGYSERIFWIFDSFSQQPSRITPGLGGTYEERYERYRREYVGEKSNNEVLRGDGLAVSAGDLLDRELTEEERRIIEEMKKDMADLPDDDLRDLWDLL